MEWAISCPALSMRWLSGCWPIRGRKCSRTNHTVWPQELLEDKANGRVPLELREVTLVDRAAVRFLAGAEATVRIINSSEHLRSWIAAERDWQHQGLHEPDKQEPHL